MTVRSRSQVGAVHASEELPKRRTLCVRGRLGRLWVCWSAASTARSAPDSHAGPASAAGALPCRPDIGLRARGGPSSGGHPHRGPARGHTHLLDRCWITAADRWEPAKQAASSSHTPRIRIFWVVAASGACRFLPRFAHLGRCRCADRCQCNGNQSARAPVGGCLLPGCCLWQAIVGAMGLGGWPALSGAAQQP
jgi:hypothetical protein